MRLLLWNYSNVLLFFFSFPPTLTILHHHTKQIIAWFAPMLFIHQHNCIKKNYYTLCTTIADGRTKLCKYYRNYIHITITKYKKTPIIHIAARSILLYKHTQSLFWQKNSSMRSEITLWVEILGALKLNIFPFFLCKKTSRIYPWKKFPLIYMHQSLNLKILHPSCAYFWLPQESPFLELFMDHVGSWLQKHLENKWLGMTKRGNQ